MTEPRQSSYSEQALADAFDEIEGLIKKHRRKGDDALDVIKNELDRLRGVRRTAVDEGDGDPEYDAIRAAAKALVPLFCPDGPTGGSYGAGLIDAMRRVESGHRASIIYPVVSRWEQDHNTLARTVDLDMIRATGIALLVYAEAYEDA